MKSLFPVTSGLVRPGIAVAFACLVCASMASAQETPPPGEPVVVVRPMPTYPPPPPPPPHEPTFSFTFSGGWARLETQDDSLLDGKDGYYFDMDFAGRANPESPLWFGVGIGGSYFDEHEDARIDSAGVPTFIDVDASMSLFTIEPRLTYVLLPRRDRGLYLAGRIGAGLLIADFWSTTVVERPFGFSVDGNEETVAAFEVRPAAQLGFCGGNWVLGAEVSQMWAWGDFDTLGDQLNELRAGIFFTIRY